jgi:hypothetical protein
MSLRDLRYLGKGEKIKKGFDITPPVLIYSHLGFPASSSA